MGHNYPTDDDEPTNNQLAADEFDSVADVETATTTVTDDGHTRTYFPARAEYRPGDDVPLVVTLDVPEYVLDVAGGFDQLTETGRLRLAHE